MTKPEPCTTAAYRHQHQSVDLTADPRPDRHPGRTGRSYCRAMVADQARVNHWLTRSGSLRRVVITSLPRCRHCDSAIAREKENARETEQR